MRKFNKINFQYNFIKQKKINQQNTTRYICFSP